MWLMNLFVVLSANCRSRVVWDPVTSKHGVDTIIFDTGFGFDPGLPFDGTALRCRLGKYNRWVLQANETESTRDALDVILIAD